MTEYETPTIVEMEDENGRLMRFQHEMTLTYRGKEYIVLSPAEEMEDLAEDEVIFLELVTSGEEAGEYRGVDDELLLEALFAEYEALCEDGEADEDAPEEE